MDSPLMTTEQAAKYLSLSAITLATWRMKKRGPDYIKTGSKVFYRQEDLDNWIKSNTVDPQQSKGER